LNFFEWKTRLYTEINQICIRAVMYTSIMSNDPPNYRPQLPQSDDERLNGLRGLMEQCWAPNHGDRPSFTNIANSLKSINKGQWEQHSESFFVSTFLRYTVLYCPTWRLPLHMAIMLFSEFTLYCLCIENIIYILLAIIAIIIYTIRITRGR
jgi:hypothetical protein